jgi:hypothetical protein
MQSDWSDDTPTCIALSVAIAKHDVCALDSLPASCSLHLAVEAPRIEITRYHPARHQLQRLNTSEVLIPPKAKLLDMTYSVSIVLAAPVM